VFEAMGLADAGRHRGAAVSYFRERGHAHVNAAELEGPFRVDGPESMRQRRWVAPQDLRPELNASSR
jgi:hypothetical protein